MHYRLPDSEMPESPNEIKKTPAVHLLKCSYCTTEYSAEGSAFRPFCCERCQQLDLRNWLTESYGLPFEGDGARELEPDDEWDD